MNSLTDLEIIEFFEGNESLQRAQTAKPAGESDTKSIKPKPIIRLQPTYMVSQIEMEEIFNEALKKVEEKRSARLGTSEPAPPVSRATTAQVKVSASVMSFANMSQKNSSVNQNIEIASDCSDNELRDDSFFRVDSAATQSKRKGSSFNSRKSSAYTAKLVAKESTSQSLYQVPSKLDNWATEHRYEVEIIVE